MDPDLDTTTAGSPSVSFGYVPAVRDARRVALLLADRLTPFLYALGIAGSILFVVMDLVSVHSGELAAFAGAFAVLLALVAFVPFVGLPARTISRMARGGWTWAVSDAGVAVAAPTWRTAQEWPAFQSWTLRDGVLLLRTSRRQGVWAVVRDVDPADVDRIEAILGAHLPRTKR